MFLKSGALISVAQNLLLVGWGKRQWTALPGSFYFPDFFLTDEKPWFTHEFQALLSMDELRLPSAHALPFVWEPPSPDLFSANFERLKNEILLKRLQKGVPYAFAEATGKPNLNWCLTHLLRYASKQPVFAYGFWDEREGMLGATPEKLFTMENGRVETVALAGTRRAGAFDAKEHKEHQFVIDGIRESLTPFGEVSLGETTEVEFPT